MATRRLGELSVTKCLVEIFNEIPISSMVLSTFRFLQKFLVVIHTHLSLHIHISMQNTKPCSHLIHQLC